MEKLLKKIEKDPEKCLEKLNTTKLAKVLDSSRELYYNKEAILSDDTFDFLELELKHRDPENKYFSNIGAPVREDVVKVDLPFWMGSLDKIYPDTREYDIWFQKNPLGPYLVTQKLDGASGLLSYSSDGDIKIYTRGDGNVGQDISFLKDNLNIPKINKNIYVRGEFIMKKSIFNEKYKDKYPKGRTVVNSVINSKKPNKETIEDIDFVTYEMVEKQGIKWSDQFKEMKKLGFQIPEYQIFETLESEKDLRKIYFDWKKDSDYEIDGAVISVDKKYTRAKSGNPKYSIAFKINLEGKKTTIQEVIWEVSKHGILKPRVKFDPVILDGDVVNYATAFNAKFIEENNLGKGTVIKIVKSGDVIPYIHSIEKPTKPDFPDLKYHWNENHVDIILENLEDSKEYKIKRLLHFFTSLKIPNISTGIVTKLFEKGFDTPKKICLMTIEDFKSLSGVREKSSKKLYDSIHSIIDKPIPLERIMTSSLSFDTGFGERKLKTIVTKYPNFLILYEKIKPEDIIKIEGFSDKTAGYFVKNIPSFISFMEEMNFLIPQKIENIKESSSKLSGKIVVFSGFRDPELKEKIEQNGGEVSDSVTKKTNYLIVKKLDENPTGKIKKAESFGICIIQIDDFIKNFML